MKLKRYLHNLIIEGHRWQYTDLIGNTDNKPRFYFTFIQFVFLLIAASSFYYLPAGFSKDAGNIVTALSIFIGLFLTVLLSVFDKFIGVREKNEIQELAETEKIALIKLKNFFKQFTSLTSYAILISIACVILLSVNWFGTFLNDSFINYPAILDYKLIDADAIWRFLRLLVIYICNGAVVYWL